MWGYYNRDRFPDLFVSNDGPNRLYRNNRDGTFTDVAAAAGVVKPKASFPAWFWDYDNDGVLDLYVGCSSGLLGVLALNPEGINVPAADPQTRKLQDLAPVSGMALYRGNGNGRFQDLAEPLGLTYPSLPMGANFGDLNNDGYLDFYLGTGSVSLQELRPNLMFLNDRGERFVNVTMSGGFGHLQKGHGVSFADLDHDGDQDIYIQMGGAFPSDKFNDALFENPGFGNHWITVQLIGTQSNRCAIGARICATIVEDGQVRTVYRHVTSGGSFGCNPLRQSLGLGKATTIQRLEVYWPTTDLTQVFDHVPVDQTIRITEGRRELERLNLKTTRIRAAGQSPPRFGAL